MIDVEDGGTWACLKHLLERLPKGKQAANRAGMEHNQVRKGRYTGTTWHICCRLRALYLRPKVSRGEDDAVKP
jgi:hypothetical protein